MVPHREEANALANAPSTNFERWLRQGVQTGSAAVRPRRPSHIPKTLRAGELRVVYQPLVELDTGAVYAYEALVRSTPRGGGPEALLQEAASARCLGALGRLIRELAVEGCPEHPLFLNVHPQEFEDGWLVQPDDPIFAHPYPIYLEITESVPLSHFELCRSVLREVRSKGARLAVDDLGAGYSNLRYIAELEPEVVKLDRSLVRGLSTSRRQWMLVRGIVRLCEDLGARVVAEGLEERDDLLAARDAGVHIGQGFLLARPASPPPKPSWEDL